MLQRASLKVSALALPVLLFVAASHADLAFVFVLVLSADSNESSQ